MAVQTVEVVPWSHKKTRTHLGMVVRTHLGMVVHAWALSTCKSEAGGLFIHF